MNRVAIFTLASTACAQGNHGSFFSQLLQPAADLFGYQQPSVQQQAAPEPAAQQAPEQAPKPVSAMQMQDSTQQQAAFRGQQQNPNLSPVAPSEFEVRLSTHYWFEFLLKNF